MNTKICKDCAEEKSLDDFYKQLSRKSGYQSYCKECSNTRRVEWARNNTHKSRQYKLKYDYGMTPDQFEQMIIDHDNKCSICDITFDGTPNIDHDHSCCGPKKACAKCVRGLLCTRCNVSVGVLETYKYLEQAIAYIEKHASVTVAGEQTGLLLR